MSIITETSTRSTDALMSSIYDMGFGESDMESLGSDTSVDGSIPKDYWFGRKYFECVMAQGVLQHSRLYENVAVVDSRLEKAMQKFPYHESLKELKLRGLESLLPIVDADPREAYRTTMCCVGAIVRSGDRK
ncbi:hypothetical protein OHC33_010971 [Knufia fluminis]|uniref:Uncharacterized protein n=1 Tax=Knufia fluminis TaxID=191047 RepID=A0AAN8I138_9EURO|nr:hypothetical protein OHC33_010971 [Knufia fluminis]